MGIVIGKCPDVERCMLFEAETCTDLFLATSCDGPIVWTKNSICNDCFHRRKCPADKPLNKRIGLRQCNRFTAIPFLHKAYKIERENRQIA